MVQVIVILFFGLLFGILSIAHLVIENAPDEL
jgi:hypothetical protein